MAKARLSKWARVAYDAYLDWQRDRCSGLAAALAFYALLGLAPFMLCVLLLSSMLFGTQTVLSQLVPLISARLGTGAVDAIKFLVKSLSENPDRLKTMSIFGIITMAWACSEYFQQLKDSIEIIWDKRREEAGVITRMKNHLFGAALALALSAIYVGSFGVRLLLEPASKTPLANASTPTLRFIDIPISYLVIFLAAAIVYRFCTPQKISRHSILVGAAITALLSTIGRIVASYVLTRGKADSVGGLAAEILVLLFWFYYNNEVTLYGAEITHHIATTRPQLVVQKAA